MILYVYLKTGPYLSELLIQVVISGFQPREPSLFQTSGTDLDTSQIIFLKNQYSGKKPFVIQGAYSTFDPFE